MFLHHHRRQAIIFEKDHGIGLPLIIAQLQE
jgi:hypothetical protein